MKTRRSSWNGILPLAVLGFALVMAPATPARSAERVVEVVVNPIQLEPGSCIWAAQDLKAPFLPQCCGSGAFVAGPGCPSSVLGSSDITRSMISFLALKTDHQSLTMTASAMLSNAPTASIQQDPVVSVPVQVIEFPKPVNSNAPRSGNQGTIGIAVPATAAPARAAATANGVPVLEIPRR